MCRSSLLKSSKYAMNILIDFQWNDIIAASHCSSDFVIYFQTHRILLVLCQGGCDEELSLFLYRGHVEEEIISALQGKEMGLRDHGELIKVHVVPYDTLWRVTADAKALAAIALYEMAKRNGFLP